MAVEITCVAVIAAAAFMVWALIEFSLEQRRNGSRQRRPARSGGAPQLSEPSCKARQVLVLHPRADRAKHVA